LISSADETLTQASSQNGLPLPQNSLDPPAASH